MLRFALPLVAVIAVFSLVLAPWALNKSAEYRKRMDQRDDASRVSPGSFKESGNADRVFFVEGGAGEEGRVTNIFISSVQHGRLGVMAAAEGYSETHANGDRFLVLGKGRRYEGTPGTTEYRVMEFDRYAIRTESREMRGVEKTPKHLSSLELLQQWPSPTQSGRTALAHRHSAVAPSIWPCWRFRCPSPIRAAGRTNNLVFALLTYMIYSNLLSVSQAWVIQGKLSFGVGVWAVHVFMFAALVLLFSRRVLVFSLGTAVAVTLRFKVFERYLAREIYAATGLILAAFLALFGFFDVIHELPSVGRGGYTMAHVAAYVALSMPVRVYELMPIAVLIGTLYALTLLARHSEITVLRASGLSTRGLLRALAKIGAVLALITFVFGEFIAPPAERQAQQLRLQALVVGGGAGVSFGTVGQGRTVLRQCARGAAGCQPARSEDLRVRCGFSIALDQRGGVRDNTWPRIAGD